MIPHKWKFLDSEHQQVDEEGNSELFDVFQCERCGIEASVQVPYFSYGYDIHPNGSVRYESYKGPGPEPKPDHFANIKLLMRDLSSWDDCDFVLVKDIIGL